MNRVVINMDPQGCFTITADQPVEVFVVCDFTPNDRVYQSRIDVGVEKVRAILRDDPVGHINDDRKLGEGYGPRKPASRPSLKVVE